MSQDFARAWRKTAAPMVLLVIVAGCSRGRTDARLHGNWEGRRGFASTLEVGFRSNGTTVMKTKQGDATTETVKGYWSVVKGGKKQITIKMKKGMSGSYQQRQIKFISDDRIELISDDGRKTRLQRIR